MNRALIVALALGSAGCGLQRSHIPDFLSELPLCSDARQEQYDGPFSAHDCAVYLGGSGNGFSNAETMAHVRFTTQPDGTGSIVVDRYSGSSDAVDRDYVVEQGLLAFDYPLYVRGTGFADFYPLTRRDSAEVFSVWVYGSEETPRVHAGDVPAGAIVNLGREVYAVTSDRAPGPWIWHVFEVENNRTVELGTVSAHGATPHECVVETRLDVQRTELGIGNLQALLCETLDDQSPRSYRDRASQDR